MSVRFRPPTRAGKKEGWHAPCAAPKVQAKARKKSALQAALGRANGGRGGRARARKRNPREGVRVLGFKFRVKG